MDLIALTLAATRSEGGSDAERLWLAVASEVFAVKFPEVSASSGLTRHFVKAAFILVLREHTTIR